MARARLISTHESEQPARYQTWVAAHAVRQPFLDHLRETGEPETFPGLAWSKPPPGAPFVLIVRDFTVDVRKRRGGEMIRCAACATDKKFATGCLAYYPEEEVIRVVGNNCGDTRRIEANAEYKQRTERTATSEYLLQSLPQMEDYLASAEGLRPAAEHAQALSNQVRRKAKTFCKAVMNEAKHGGDLLTKLVLAEDADGRDASHRVTIHRLTGSGFLRPNYEPATKLGLAVARLRVCHFGDEERSLGWLIEHVEDYEELAKLAVMLKSALAIVDEVRTLLSVARAFLTAENMRGIDRWAFEACPEVRAQWSASQIWFKGPSQNSRSFSTAIKPDYGLLARAK